MNQILKELFMSKTEKIVVTGASGFLGSHLISCLRDLGEYTVYALSSRPEDLKTRIGGSNIEFLFKDAIEESQAPEFLTEAVVVNCAYPRNTEGTAVADGLKYILSVFTLAVENGAKGIINISSQSVYSSQRTEPATEETALCLESPYAVGKYATELMLESACKNSSTAYTNVRMASLIGPEFHQRIINRLVKTAIETGQINVAESSQLFGFLDVEDAVYGLSSMLNFESQHWNKVYNLGRHDAYTLKDISEIIAEEFKDIYNRTIVINYQQEQKIMSSAVNADLFMNTFNYRPHISLKESIRRIMSAYIIPNE